MIPRRLSVTAIVFVGWLMVSTVPLSGQADPGVGGVPAPVVPRGLGEACVADTDYMRRNHMSVLQHQRDETVRQGVRGNPYSLEECIACHAVAGPGGQSLTVDSPQHFCRSCHDYAAVSIDCFQCHASRPSPDGTRDRPGTTPGSVASEVAQR